MSVKGAPWHYTSVVQDNPINLDLEFINPVAAELWRPKGVGQMHKCADGQSQFHIPPFFPQKGRTQFEMWLSITLPDPRQAVKHLDSTHVKNTVVKANMFKK